MTTLPDLQRLSDEELIVAVATQVMGWQKGSEKRPGIWIDPKKPDEFYGVGYTWNDSDWDFDDFNPLTDWNHTMEVVEKLVTGYPAVALQMYGGGVQAEQKPIHAQVKLFNDMDMKVECTDRWQRAICLAALLAVSSSHP